MSLPPSARATTARLRRFMPAIVITGAILAACSSNDNTTNTTPTATAIAIISGNTQTGVVGTPLPLPLVVKVTDQNGAAMSGVTVNFTASGGATLRAASSTTDANGQATDSLTLLGTVAGSDTVTASVSGIATSAIFSFVASAGPAAQVSIVSGNNQSGTVGTALTSGLVIKVTDAFGNPVSNATIDWTTTAGQLAGTTQTTSDASGQVTAALQLPAVIGPVTVTATLHGTATAAVFTETAM